MRQKMKDPNILLVEAIPGGQWAVRWDIKPKLDENGNETGWYWYEEHLYNWIPTIEDVQLTISEWFNKQTDDIIENGFEWNGIRVYLNDENKFNYKAITDEATRREQSIKLWDEENPELAGKDYLEIPVYYPDLENELAFIKHEPTGRPKSSIPVTLKLGKTNEPENFYVFNTLKELQDFFSAGVDHLLNAYGMGWYKIATYDWNSYIEAINKL